MQVLATTTPGFESVAGEEVHELVGARTEPAHRGALGFETDAEGLVTLNRRSRTLNRTLVVLREGRFESLTDVGRLVESLPLERYLADGQAFAVRADRHGTHEFGSPDVARVVGQAVIDGYRDATGHRLPVDLDDPDVTLRAYVRDDRFLFAVDATGESLHARDWRVCEHEAPMRPTTAAALCRLAGVRVGDRVGTGETILDPMCGSGTLPVEAALTVAARPIAPDRERSLSGLAFLEDDLTERVREAQVPRDGLADVRGWDVEPRWVECARENAASAGVEATFEVTDAIERELSADRIVVNPPYGRRLDLDVRSLYRDLFRALDRGTWKRAVLLTSRPELVPWEPDRRVDVRLGRIEAAALVFT